MPLRSLPRSRRFLPRHRPATVAFLGVLLCFLLAPIAGGQEADAGPDPFDEALAKIQRNELSAAVADLERLRAEGDRRAAAALGAVYVRLDRHADALEVLEPLIEEHDDPGVLYNAGRAAVGVGDFDRGLDMLRRSAELAPGSPAVRELGVLLGRGGDSVGAFPYLRRWSTLHPEDEEARLLAAVAAVQLERAPDAEAMLSDLAQDDPGVQLLWGQTLLLKGEPYAALGYLEPLVADAPEAMQADVRRASARAHMMAGESNKAIDVLEGHAEGNPQLTLQLAQAHYQNGDVQQALGLLQPFAERIAATPDRSSGGSLAGSIVLEHGRLLLTDDRPDEALPYLRMATEIIPREKLAWQSLGQALAASGDNDGARQAIARFQQLADDEGRQAPNQVDVERNDPTAKQLRLAFEKLTAGEDEEALRILEQESVLNPEDARIPLLASRVLLSLQRPGEALRAVELSLELRPTTDGLYQRGAVLMSLQRLDEAEESLRAALESNPEHSPTLNDLAVLLMNQNRRDEARTLLARALEIWPEDPVAKQNLDRLDG